MNNHLISHFGGPDCLCPECVMSPAEKRIEKGIARLMRGEVLTPKELRQLQDALYVLTVGR